MQIHIREHDLTGGGKWDMVTTRYIPIYGGSRSRLPIYDDPDYRRYHGFVGIDESLTPHLFLLPDLYRYMGGKPIVHSGDAGRFTSLILGETLERLEEEVAGGDDSPAM